MEIRTFGRRARVAGRLVGAVAAGAAAAMACSTVASGQSQGPVLEVTKEADHLEYLRGEEATYTITVRNVGGRPAVDPQFTDDPRQVYGDPPGQPPASATATLGTASVVNGVVSWQHTMLQPGESAQVQYKIIVRSTGEGFELPNTVTARLGGTEASAPKSCTVTIARVNPNRSARQTPEPGDIPSPRCSITLVGAVKPSGGPQTGDGSLASDRSPWSLAMLGLAGGAVVIGLVRMRRSRRTER